MKKLLSILLISVILFSCSDSEKRYHIDEVSFPNDTLTFLKKDMSLLNGLVFSELGELGVFKDGKMEGLQMRWYDNRQLKMKGNYINGQRNGLWEYYYDNGQITCRDIFILNKINGVSIYWSENGNQLDKKNYVNGVEDGKQIYFEGNRNNFVEREEVFKLGKKISVSYFKNNKKINTIFFDKNGIEIKE